MAEETTPGQEIEPAGDEHGSALDRGRGGRAARRRSRRWPSRPEVAAAQGPAVAPVPDPGRRDPRGGAVHDQHLADLPRRVGARLDAGRGHRRRSSPSASSSAPRSSPRSRSCARRRWCSRCAPMTAVVLLSGSLVLGAAESKVEGGGRTDRARRSTRWRSTRPTSRSRPRTSTCRPGSTRSSTSHGGFAHPRVRRAAVLLRPAGGARRQGRRQGRVRRGREVHDLLHDPGHREAGMEATITVGTPGAADAGSGHRDAVDHAAGSVTDAPRRPAAPRSTRRRSRATRRGTDRARRQARDRRGRCVGCGRARRVRRATAAAQPTSSRRARR